MDPEKLFQDFIKTGLYLRNWSPKTVRTYKQAWSSFQQSLTGNAANSVDQVVSKAQLEAWVIWLRERGVSPGGCNMYIRTINSFLSWLRQEGHLSSSIRLRLLSNPPKPISGLTDNEIRSLLSFRAKSFYDLRTWTLINTLLDTGSRIDELLTLDINKVDLDNLQAVITGKGNKTRIIPVSLELRKSLFRYFKLREGRGINSIYAFCTSSGHKLSYRNTFRDIKLLCKKAGVTGAHVHPHAFRHCFATTYIRRGGDIYRLSRVLGHTSISTTQIYLRSMGIEQIGENHSSLSPLSKY